MNSTTLRISTTVTATCGVLGVLGFAYYWADGFAWQRFSFSIFVRVSAPYFVVAVAAAFRSTRMLAMIAFAVSLGILALAAWTYSSLGRTGPYAINDITLITFPLQSLLSCVALAAAIIGWTIQRIRHASLNYSK